MLFDEFQRQRPANTITIHVGRSCYYDIFGEDALKAAQVLDETRLRTIAWNGLEIPALERMIYSLKPDATSLIEAGFELFICRRATGVYHYELFQVEEPEPKPTTHRRPVPPSGYTAIKGELAACPVCGRTGRRWGPGAAMFQDSQAQAMYLKVEEDRDDWGWLLAILHAFGFEAEHIWRLMGSAPMWTDPQYRVEGQSLISHWSRYSVGHCDCGAKFWHDWGDPRRYYLKIPANPRLPKPKVTAPPQPSEAQLRLF